ncbi:Cof-type HAD-IIB family hydrolase [Photobacterium rosenbergii]|uniref:Cof-type HAD-IIB family hydrolase n=1 Tax=Photobacterium rosenbergii TaxID=294936 RepID=A0ABU3ZJ69_9GAMM|nr:Cof-type HAD-IIB family hydrolase [Photobacterium rosenbergii]MDV5169933.1 Cof-type HAD-IIB family hydrolase [Photobacterium rosenbergii]
MKHQLLALDLDGTALQDNHQLNSSIAELVHSIKSQYHVVIVTGRHHTAAKPYYDEFNLDTPIICCNGTYTYHYQQGKVLDHKAIDKGLAQRFIQSAELHQLKMVMYVTDAMTYSLVDPIPYMQPLNVWAKTFPPESQPNIYQTDDFASLAEATDYVWKFVVEGEADRLEAFLRQAWVETHFEGAWSGESRIDLAMRGNNKGEALARYAQQLGIAPNSIVAAGDNFNDISMLEMAGIGIAMQQADPVVKQRADVICETDNHGDGLATLVKGYFPLAEDK